MTPTRSPHARRSARPRFGPTLAFLALMLAIFGAAVTNGGLAAKKADTIVSIGESNSQDQRDELLGYFGADKNAKVDVITVAQTKDAMQDVIPDFNLSSAFSSAALTCRPLGEGLDVTTINITQITPAMYAMALVTAGVGDAKLIVAAPAAATLGIFMPAFLLVGATHGLAVRIRSSASLSHILDGLNLASNALLVGDLVTQIRDLDVSVVNMLVGAIALAGLASKRAGPTTVLVAAAIVGLLWHGL
jgi:hypothetical protein